QEHFRGRSVHADLRIEAGDGQLIGWTLNTQVAGSIEAPVTTADEARDAAGHSKIDWESGDARTPVAAERKERCPASWLGFEGVIEPGEVGALQDGPGVVAIVDRGFCEFGAQRPGYHEYFMNSDHPAGGLTGRVVFTKLEGGPTDVWLFALPEDDTPHVLSDRAVADGWVPAQGFSALPAGLRDDVPEERRFWVHAEETDRQDARDALVAALRDGVLELSGLNKALQPGTAGEIEKRKLVPFNQWGSSAKYAKRLAAKLPEHTRYVEPFCGAAALLFAKDRAQEEILADTDSEVVFALKYIQRLTPQKFEALKAFNWKVSRTGFKRVRACTPTSDAERFWKLVYCRLCSWGGQPKASGFSTIHDGQTYKLDELWRFHERLKGAMVVRQDWRETLRKADSRGTLFFIDPPYVEEWGPGGGIPPEEIAEAVSKLKGSFVIAYTDSARARRALSKVGNVFTMKLLEARNRGLWAKRSRLFVASFAVKKDARHAGEPELVKSKMPSLPVPFECAIDIAKAYEDDGRWIVEGFAATSDFDLQDDIISEQAIQESAKDLLENSTVLHNHNADEAIGRVLDSKAVSGGLFLKIMISKTAPEKWQQIKEGVLNKFSVRGKVIEARKRWVAELKRHARIILKMQLVEVSLVAVPANPKARAVRWYVEKALDEFEKAGGLLDSGAKAMAGGFPMKEEREVEKVFPGEVSEELIEASGETRDEAGQPEKSAAAQKDGAAGGDGVLALIEKLISGETDPERKKALEQVRDALKQPPVSKAAAGEGGIEKAGRKVSSARLKRLKSLLEELKSLVSEVDDNSDDKEAKKTADAGGDGPSDKITEIEGTIGKIAQALGITQTKEGEVPNLAETVTGLQKRLDDLEGTPADRASLDEDDEKAGKGSVWKGLL
ncbi:MAG: DNA adenine methylase, partial [Planctomycetota bacterium]